MKEIRFNNFEEEVLQSELPVFVDFYGESCAICMDLLPGVHEMEKDYEGRIVFAGIDTGSERKLAMKQRVMGLPTMVVYEGGEKKVVKGPLEIKSLGDVRAFLDEYLSSKE
ncbi:MAG TPA: thioredoxin family protein [Clostridiaceae bacterium]|nr:thioredoxin family protein [Clostridiaceae bacterium]